MYAARQPSDASVYYQAICDSDDAAFQAFHDTEDIFDTLLDVKSLARKRSGSALLCRFDDSPEAVEKMVTILRNSGFFREVLQISEVSFWRAPSNGV